MISPETTDMTTIIRRLEDSNFYEKEKIVITVDSYPGPLFLLKTFNEYKIQNIIIFSLFGNNLDLKYENQYNNSLYIIDNYYYGINTKANNKYLKFLNENINYPNGKFDSSLASGIVAINFLYNCIDQIGPNIRLIKQILLNMEYDCPQGRLKMKIDNQLTNYLYITKYVYDKNKNESILEPMFIPLKPYNLVSYYHVSYYQYNFITIGIMYGIKSSIYCNMNDYQIILGLIDEYNGNKTSNLVIPKIYYNNDTDDGWIENCKMISEEIDITYIIAGSRMLISHILVNYLRKDQIVFLAGNSVGEECYKNIITFGTLPNQVFSTFITAIMNMGYNNLLIYYKDYYPYNLYAEILESTSVNRCNTTKSVFLNDINSLHNLLYSLIDYTPIVVIAEDYEVDTLVEILKLLDYDFFSTNPIVGALYEYHYNPIIDLKGLYFLSPYSNSFDVFEPYREISYQYTTFNRGSSLGLYSYLAINFLFNTLSEWQKNEKNNSFFDVLYNQKVLDYTVEKNNYISHYFFLIEYSTNTIIQDFSSLLSLTKPSPYDYYYHNPIRYVCDFTGERLEIRTRYILLILSYSTVVEINDFTDYGLEESASISIDEINNNNILNFTLSLLIYNYKNDENLCKNIIGNYTEEYDILFFIFSGSNNCRKNMIPSLREYNKILFQVNHDEGEECEENVFYSGLNPSLYVSIIRALNILYNNKYYFITEAKGLYYNILYESVHDRNLDVELLPLVEYNNVKNQVELIIGKYKEPIIILCEYEDERLNILLEYLEEYSKENENFKYKVFIFKVFTRKMYLLNVKNVYFISVLDLLSSKFHLYKEKVKPVLSHDTFISGRMGNCYSVIHLSSMVLSKINENDTNTFRKELYNVYFDGPTGNVSFQHNNRLVKDVKLYYIKDKDNIECVLYSNYTTKEFTLYNRYNDKSYVCDWSVNSENGIVEFSSIIQIGFIQFEYGNHIELNKLLYEIITYSTEIYEEERKLDYPYYQIYTISSGDNNFQLCYNIRSFLSTYINVSIFIGGVVPFERDEILKCIEHENIILFYTGLSEGYNCYSNVISTGTLIQNYENVFTYYGSNFTGALVFLTDNSIESKTMVNDLEYLCISYAFPDLGVYNIDTSSNESLMESLSYSWSKIKELCEDTRCVICNTLSHHTEDIIMFFYRNSVLSISSNCYLYNFFPDILDILYLLSYPDLSNCYFLSSYPYEMSKIRNGHIINNILDRIKNNNRMISENIRHTNVVTGVNTIELLSIVLKRSKYNPSLILQHIHDAYFLGFSEATLYSNNYLSTRITLFTLRLQNFVLGYVTNKITIPNPFPQISPENFGIKCVLNDDTLYQSKLPYIVITIVRTSEEDMLLISRVHSIVLTNLIDNENEYGSISNYLLMPYIITYKDELSDYVIEKGFKDPHVKVVIGCFTNECQNYILKLCDEYDKIFFFSGSVDETESNSHLIRISTLPSHIARISVDFFSMLHFNEVIILYEDDTFGHNLQKVISEMIKKEFTVLNEYFVSLNNISVINEVREIYLTNENILVFNCLKYHYLTYFLDNTMDIDSNTYTYVLFYYSSETIQKTYKQFLIGHYYISSYIGSDFGSSFYKGLESIVENIYEVTTGQYMENEYISLQLFISAFNFALDYTKSKEDLSTNILLASLLKVSFTSSDYSIKIDNNLYGKRNAYIFEMKDSSTGQLVYPQIGLEQKYNSTYNIYYGPEDVQLYYNFGVKCFLHVLLVLVEILNLLSLIFVFYNQKNPVIVKSTVSLLKMYFFGIFILLASVYFFIEEPTNDIMCGCRIWLFSTGVCFIFSILFSKIWRIDRLFNNKELTKIHLPNKKLYLIISLSTLLELLYVTIWQIIDPSKITKLMVNNNNILENNFYYQCTSNMIFTYI